MIRKKKRLGGKTRAGRLMKRLLGDTAGGVLMEYVVLGLLVVSAVVVFVMAFSGALGSGFQSMINTLLGRAPEARKSVDDGRTTADTEIEAAKAHQKHIDQQ